MTRLTDSSNFLGRVNYAAAVISNRRATTRGFDNCFEMYDGDEVVVALMRRSINNPKLAENIHSYLTPESCAEAVRRFVHIPTRQLAKQAAETRARKEAEFRLWLEEQKTH